MPKYRYLGARGVFIENQHYHGGEIVITKKPIDELGFDGLLFEQIEPKLESRETEHEIHVTEDEIGKAELELKKKQKLVSAQKLHIAHLKTKKEELETQMKNEIDEQKRRNELDNLKRNEMEKKRDKPIKIGGK